jgi:hypothetical protein
MAQEDEDLHTRKEPEVLLSSVRSQQAKPSDVDRHLFGTSHPQSILSLGLHEQGEDSATNGPEDDVRHEQTTRPHPP